MNYPTVKQLRYFIALVEQNHFGKAAKKCFVSQSAFSVAIKEFENNINASLVDRTNKTVTITNLGREIYSQAKYILQNLSHLIETAQSQEQPLVGKLSLGIIPSIAPFILNNFLGDLYQSHKDIELYLHEAMTLNLYGKLMNGELDVILIALPYDLKNVEFEPIFKDCFHLAYSKNSKWIKKIGTTLKLNNESILLLEDGHCMRDHTLSACKLKNFEKVSKYEASSMLTLIEMVKSDIGITYLPEMSLHSDMLKQTDIITKQLDMDSYREIGLVWRKGSARAAEFKLLAEIIKRNNI